MTNYRVDACARSGRYRSEDQIRDAANAIEKEVYNQYGQSKQYYEPSINAKINELRSAPAPPPQHNNIPQSAAPFEIPNDPEFLERSQRYHTVYTSK
jgi:hypothetical protein